MAKEIIAVKCPRCSRVEEISYYGRADTDLPEDKLTVYELPHQECPELNDNEDN